MESLYKGQGIILPSNLQEKIHKGIPRLSYDEMKQIYVTTKPIATIKNVKFNLREYSLEEMRNTSYIWDLEQDKTTIVEKERLQTLRDFLCLHTWGYYGLFKPSIAEILSQLPEELRNIAQLFEIIEGPETRDDVFRYSEVIDNGFHLSKVRAYQLKK